MLRARKKDRMIEVLQQRPNPQRPLSALLLCDGVFAVVSSLPSKEYRRDRALHQQPPPSAQCFHNTGEWILSWMEPYIKTTSLSTVFPQDTVTYLKMPHDRYRISQKSNGVERVPAPNDHPPMSTISTVISQMLPLTSYIFIKGLRDKCRHI
ncbi:hypothetical protein IFM60648_03274 [Aspergillus lentulus]|uniref:Uncharacterized protein n=1 Tax=Aspergillus lentulus TaxID=293939 RepID=A0ABQ1A137_ASPLE|nr:hypothetical protein IFM60648_03274 [Aspergillus lentulus]